MPFEVRFVCCFLKHPFCCKCRKKHRKKRFTCIFEACEGQKDDVIFAFLQVMKSYWLWTGCWTCLIVSLLEEYYLIHVFQFQLFQLFFEGGYCSRIWKISIPQKTNCNWNNWNKRYYIFLYKAAPSRKITPIKVTIPLPNNCWQGNLWLWLESLVYFCKSRINLRSCANRRRLPHQLPLALCHTLQNI